MGEILTLIFMIILAIILWGTPIIGIICTIYCGREAYIYNKNVPDIIFNIWLGLIFLAWLIGETAFVLYQMEKGG